MLLLPKMTDDTCILEELSYYGRSFGGGAGSLFSHLLQ